MLHTVFFYEKRFRNAFGVRERIIVFLLNIYVKSLIAYTNKQSVGRINVGTAFPRVTTEKAVLAYRVTTETAVLA